MSGNRTQKIIEQHKKLFESLISAGTIKQAPDWEKSHADVTAWSYDMEGYDCDFDSSE